MKLAIRELQAGDLLTLQATDGGSAWKTETAKWMGYLAGHRRGDRLTLLAASDQAIVGYGSLLWESGYPPFQQAGIPEIKDVVVAERERRQGVGAALISALEARAQEAGRTQIGIAVGLYDDYGPAQRLYVRLGYVPDGRGMSRGYSPVSGGSGVKADDDLLLWLVKAIGSAK